MTSAIRPRFVLLDLLMATMDSMSTWSEAAGDPARGLAWRDAVTERMIAAGAYVPYEKLVAETAAALAIGTDGTSRLRRAWHRMRLWPDATRLATLDVPFGFVTNCSTELARAAVSRSGLSPSLVLSAEEAGVYKPRPEIYHQACRRLGIEPSQARYVAGAAYDAIGADAAGVPAVLVRRREPDRSLPVRIGVVETISETLVG